MTRRTIIFWKTRLGQIGHTLFIFLFFYLFFSGREGGGGGRGMGVGCVKITLIVSCLEWLIRLFLILFILVEFEKVQHRLILQMTLISLVTKVFQKGTMFK